MKTLMVVLFALALPVMALAQQPADQKTDPAVSSPSPLKVWDDAVRAEAARTGKSYMEAAADLSARNQIGGPPAYEPWNPIVRTSIPNLNNNYYGGYYGGYGYDPYLLGVLLDRCQTYLPTQSRPVECIVSEFKFDIDGRGLGDEVEVLIDGRSIGKIGKYSHRLTSGLRVASDTDYQMELVWTPKKGRISKSIIKAVQPISMRIQDGPIWFTVNKELFDNAPYGRIITPTREEICGKELVTGKPCTIEKNP